MYGVNKLRSNVFRASLFQDSLGIPETSWVQIADFDYEASYFTGFLFT